MAGMKGWLVGQACGLGTGDTATSLEPESLHSEDVCIMKTLIEP